jgi:hypothetical protein
MSAASGWQDYTPPQGGGWQNYQPDQKRSAASPITPPKMNVGAPSSQPMAKHYLVGGEEEKPLTESVGRFGQGILQGTADVTTPVIAHRVGQKTGILPKGDIYPGEGELKDVPGKATVMMAGGLEGETPEPIQQSAKAISETTPKPSGSTALKIAGHLPYVGKYIRLGQTIGDLLGGGKQEAAPTSAPTAPPIPETNGIPWGSGGQSPIAMRGQRILVEEAPAQAPQPSGDVSPPKPPAKVVRQSTALGPNAKVMNQSQSLGRPISFESTYPNEARMDAYAQQNPNVIKLWQQGAGFEGPEATQDIGEQARAATEKKMGPLPRGQAIPIEDQHIIEKPRYSDSAKYNYQTRVPSGEYVPTPYAYERGARIPEDILDDHALQQEMAQDLETHGRVARAEAGREFAARNAVGTPKGELIRQSRVAQPIPLPDEDLTPTWQKALDDIKAKKVPNTNTETGAKFDNEVLDKVKQEHPDWSLSQQLQEAAKRAKLSR